MRLSSVLPEAARRLSLTQQVALLSLIPMAALGAVLAGVLQTQIVSRTLADESQSARLIARIGIQPRLTPRDLREGLSAAQVRSLDRQLRTASVKRDLARIKLWNSHHTVIYSDDHSLIGRTLAPSDDLQHALAGRPNPAVIVDPSPHSETAAEVGLGRLVEVYVPLRFSHTGSPAGAFEIYMSYRPIAGAVARDKRTIVLLVAIGLTLLWLVLYRIVARASRRLAQHAQENDRLARFDLLTGLPNRTLFTERLEAALRRGRGEANAVLMIDLDGFKQVNSTLGASTGDEVLREVARRLQDGLGDGTLVARLGNDEFAILCSQAGGADGALLTAAAVQHSLEAPVTAGGVALNVGVCIGLAAASEDSSAADELLRHAEAALARARVGGGVEVYSPQLDRFDPQRLILLGQVRSALERGEFLLHYQPKIELAGGRITGVEALLRWRHPQKGLLGPGAFVSLIEPTALIGPLTLYAVEQAARQIAQWLKDGVDLEMSVNLSARNLLDEQLAEKLFEVLDRYGVHSERLTVEVTESAAMTDPDRAVAVLRRLRAGGVGVSIDDFGTGNASIDYLARLPASELKIDRSFVAHICDDTRSQAIVRSTVDLARNLGLKVVAEGIETEQVLDRVAALGCHAAQGYFISPPLPAQELAVRMAGQPSPAVG